jgi:hypothetical protein
MQCLTDNGGGSFTTAAPQPTDYTVCTYLLVQPSELQPQIFNLTVEEGIWLGFQLTAILVVGFIFRAIARALNSDERYHHEDV